MQTFLPFDEFRLCAKVLSNEHLEQQRRDVQQLLALLTGEAAEWRVKAWSTHPLLGMWQGYEEALAWYGAAMCDERMVRGFPERGRAAILEAVGGDIHWTPELPYWLGTMDVHVSHRAQLVWKDEEHYGPMFPEVEGRLDIVYPA